MFFPIPIGGIIGLEPNQLAIKHQDEVVAHPADAGHGASPPCIGMQGCRRLAQESLLGCNGLLLQKKEKNKKKKRAGALFVLSVDITR